jgi:hypothetical protein
MALQPSHQISTEIRSEHEYKVCLIRSTKKSDSNQAHTENFLQPSHHHARFSTRRTILLQPRGPRLHQSDQGHPYLLRVCEKEDTQPAYDQMPNQKYIGIPIMTHPARLRPTTAAAATKLAVQAPTTIL